MISMARPFLADPHFAEKAKRGDARAINVCIACNQACLDQVFVNKKASCLVNPRAGNETELIYQTVTKPKRIAVVGAGPAGLAFAATAAERGHEITLFERGENLGGQFNLAKRIPGKEEFQHTINFFMHQLETYKVEIRLQTHANLEQLKEFDEVVLATGVEPRIPHMQGIQHKKVMTYIDAIHNPDRVGSKVAVMGAGGIGFDVAELLTHSPAEFYNEWGIDINVEHRGGIKPTEISPSPREVYLVQRKKEKMGQRLGKTTGWIHRLSLKHKKVKMLTGVTYVKIDDQGLHLLVQDEPLLLDVDSIIICTGQLELRTLFEPLKQAGQNVHLIGGAFKALELDARHAIDQACRLAAIL